MRLAPSIVLLAGSILSGCGPAVEQAARHTTVRMASFRSTAKVIGDALAHMPGVAVETVSLDSSPAVLGGLNRNAIDLGVSTADVAYLAFSGHLTPDAPPFGSLRGLAVLGLETLHLLAGKESPVNSLDDLRGSRVGGGPNSKLVAELLLKASGVAPEVEILVLPNQEVTNRVADGRLDAALINLNTSPPPDYTIAAVKAGMRLLEIKGPGVERLRLRHPFLVRTLIPPGTYPNQDQSIRTIGVDLLLLCRADFDDELAYEFMRAYFGVLAKVNVAIDLDRAPAMAIPLHPGAVRYYRERELAQ